MRKKGISGQSKRFGPKSAGFRVHLDPTDRTKRTSLGPEGSDLLSFAALCWSKAPLLGVSVHLKSRVGENRPAFSRKIFLISRFAPYFAIFYTEEQE